MPSVLRLCWVGIAVVAQSALLVSVSLAQQGQSINGTLVDAGPDYVSVKTDAGQQINVPVTRTTKVEISGKGPRELLRVGSVVRVHGRVEWKADEIIKAASFAVCAAGQTGEMGNMVATHGDTGVGVDLIARVEKLDPMVVRVLPETGKVLFINAQGQYYADKKLTGSTFQLEQANRDAPEIELFFGNDIRFAGKDAIVRAVIWGNNGSRDGAVTIERKEPLTLADLEPPKKKRRARRSSER